MDYDTLNMIIVEAQTIKKIKTKNQEIANLNTDDAKKKGLAITS